MSHEAHANPNGPPQLEDLLDGRYELAVQQAENEARSALNFDRRRHPDTVVDNIEDTTLGYDIGKIRPTDLMTFDALGISPVDLAVATRQYATEESDVIFEPTVGDESIAIRHYGEGISVRLSITGHEADFNHPRAPVAMREQVKQRYAKSPAYQALTKARALWQDQKHLPPVITTEPFSANEDPLGTIAFLDDIGLLNGNPVVDKLRAGDSIEEINLHIDDMLDRGIAKEVTPDGTIYTWGEAAQKKLAHDRSEGTYTYSITQRPEVAYSEIANQDLSSEAVPFLETECARELCTMLDEAGLMFHPAFQLEMMRVGEAERFGSVYTQISREIAKWVDRPDRAVVSNLFRPKNPAYSGKLLIENSNDFTFREYTEETDGNAADLETTVRDLWQNAEVNRTDSGEATQAIVDMVDDVMARLNDNEPATDLPVTDKEIKISGGSCFDVTAYYLISKTVPYTAENDVPMLEKLGGAHTFLTTEPITFNGVRLPKGALMTHESDGWAFLRLTPFSFDNPDDKLAFGSEVSKALGEQQVTAQTLGSLSLSHIQTKY